MEKSEKQRVQIPRGMGSKESKRGKGWEEEVKYPNSAVVIRDVEETARVIHVSGGDFALGAIDLVQQEYQLQHNL